MDKLTFGLIALGASVVAVVFWGVRVAVVFWGVRKDDEDVKPRSSVDPKMVIKPPRTGDESMVKRPPHTGDEGMARPPTTTKTRTI